MNQKPEWKHAPDWANYLAMDSATDQMGEDVPGRWVWYELEPKPSNGYWLRTGGRVQEAYCPPFEDTLEERPK